MKLYFAQGYGCTDYGETIAYNSCVPLNGSSDSSSALANTGIGIIAIATLACILIFLGLILRFVRRHKKNDDDDNNKTGNKTEKAV